VASEMSLDPTAVVGVAIDRGSLGETTESKGLASMLRRMILTSTEKRDGQDLSAQLEELGASVIRSEASCRDSTYVGGEMLQPSCESFLELLSESLVHPSFSTEEVEFQKNSMRFEREDWEKDPDRRIEELLFAKAFPTHPLGWPSVKKICSFFFFLAPIIFFFLDLGGFSGICG
jgi:mitochondrial-processing peptidase subunit alpha